LLVQKKLEMLFSFYRLISLYPRRYRSSFVSLERI
jgi:hypothetical protein